MRAKAARAPSAARPPGTLVKVPPRYWLETLGCPKNQVDSDKLAGMLEADGLRAAAAPGQADVVVVNTCAFIEAAREESVETVLALASARKDGARLVVTGCMAERYGQELARALPEVDQVAGFGVPVEWGRGAARSAVPSFDLLNLARPAGHAPWAYVKVAEGCDRHCGFCAIPSFRGPQRSRPLEAVLDEVDALGVSEVVLVAQDLVSWGRDGSDLKATAVPAPLPSRGRAGLVTLLGQVAARVERARLLYLYPSGLTDELVDAIGASGCPYFDLSLQHVSRPLLQRMRRYGDGRRFLAKVARTRALFPEAAFRSSFIVGYPGETEADHDQLLAFLDEAQLDWAGFFAFSPEEGTYASRLPDQVPASLVAERLAECSERQEAITRLHRQALIGTKCRVLVDAPGIARSHREAPEIDGIVQVPQSLVPGSWAQVEVVDAIGPDLVGQLL